MSEEFGDRLKGSSLADLARDRLRAAIIEGKMKPGDRINIERVADMFGISRTPIREALKALEMDGMVRIEAHRGAVVEPLAWREIGHHYAIRGMLEGYAARLACEKRDPGLIAALLENCARTKKEVQSKRKPNASKIAQMTELTNGFHRLIWDACDSAMLVRFLNLLQLPRAFGEAFWVDEKFGRDVCCQHDEIAAAFVAGDADRVRLLMEQHMHAASDMVAAAAQADISAEKNFGTC